ITIPWDTMDPEYLAVPQRWDIKDLVRFIIILGPTSISFSFFAAEISVGFYTHSLALVADAFHYMNDLVGFIVALAAIRRDKTPKELSFGWQRAQLIRSNWQWLLMPLIKISQRDKTPKELSFGWQRAQLLGAFFNGVFLLALGVSIFLQSIERFVSLQKVQNPILILIMGCVDLVLNIISVLFLHEHDNEGEPDQQASDDNNIELSTLQDVSVLFLAAHCCFMFLTRLRLCIPTKIIVIN
ncbi:hypothetical protein V490_00404, partial [Pseudogymnoascus sp. VKM F-3557]